ncbi:glucose/galactose transporter, putative [Talaromyces stipitatus ATCC 10500]|uniref:Glucose/galactose transporter, putative n=1 Tax=Talaromyces stipitatus (strain ATCC 10500 / CBS 375.48 / QM 6759 / NRRL 1006) TaxID=441959 RepID=B8MI38_TALSN|nr:glucose/galactose transporter, putative [Talaromyces stipitatus ATCC 10500]EED17200.1 glucose/galactose transporter, putative [Talaromyces stipitatus ATCC 10500]
MTLPLRQKLILVITFGVAIFVIVVDLIRMAVLEHSAIIQLRLHHAASVGMVGDGRYPFTFMWSTAEVNMTLICACVPSLRPLAARFSPSLLRNPQGKSEIEQGTLEESQQAPSRSGAVAGEMMDAITLRVEAEAQVEQASRRGTGDPFQKEEEPPIINILNMRPASMLRLNKKESFPPNVLLTTLFFMWGFSYGLISVLNIRFGSLVQLNAWQLRGLHAAYYGGYMVGGILLGRIFLKKLGFAGTLIAGLYIYACGALLFWPSAVLGSLPTFIVSNVVAGSGLALLETTANLSMAICGPLEYSEIRLCVAQFFEGIGHVCGMQLAENGLFKNSKDATKVVNAQWTYLVIAFISVLLSVIFYYLPLPEAPNDDLRQLAAQRPENKAKIWSLQTCNITFGLGVWAMFLYFAGQEAHAVNLQDYVRFSDPNLSINPNNLGAIAYTVLTVGRLSTAFIVWRLLKPRWTLFVLYIGIIVFGTLCMHTTGLTAVVMAIMVYLFLGGIFPLVFAISVRGMAQHAKTAASLLAASVGGGAWSPFPQHAAALSHGQPWSYSVMIALWSAGAIFVLYLNFVPQAKRQVDPVQDDYIKEE